MLRYVGGKFRYAKEIAYCISKHRKPEHRYYIEPFVGGGNVIAALPHLDLKRYASDVNGDLILMYQALVQGWLPPNTISEDVYDQLRNAAPSPLRGYAGFAASFGGKWFGGYARGANRNFSLENYRRLLRSVDCIKNVTFAHRSYREIKVNTQCLIYCDPPYANTLGYNSTSFDHDLFWDTIRSWSNQGATVLVSEYVAPDDFRCIWQRDHFTRAHLSNSNINTIEKIFMIGS